MHLSYCGEVCDKYIIMTVYIKLYKTIRNTVYYCISVEGGFLPISPFHREL